MYQSIRPIGPKYTNLVEDIEDFLSVKIRKLPFSGCRVQNVSANQMSGWPSLLTFQLEKSNFVEDVEFLLPIVELHLAVAEKIRKCLRQTEAWEVIFGD